MANREHTRVAKQGKDAITAWRAQNRGTRFDLTKADLRETDLCGVDLYGADLRGVCLQGAKLTAADLREATLRDAHLQEVNLDGAKLSRADLNRANLSRATLCSANLDSASLIEVDLSSAKLNDASLVEANLTNAFFSFTKLNKADLSRSKWPGADVLVTDLQEAKLNYANLYRADLSRSDMRRANLKYANLFSARLCEVMLGGADFKHAELRDTSFASVDLSGVNGLEDVVHRGPSSIGVDTLYRSQGKIPEEFLRGCGVPEDFITYLPSLIGTVQPIQYQSCFISYSSQDDEFARRLHEKMRSEKLRVWFAPEDMQGGKKLIEQIDRAIQVNDRLLLVLSEHSMNSEWVKTELRKARQAELREQRQKLFPIRLVNIDHIRDWSCFDADTGKDLAVELREYHIPDFSNWKDHDAFESAFADLLRDLRAQA